MQPTAHKSEQKHEKLELRTSGETYCAVPTNECLRGVVVVAVVGVVAVSVVGEVVVGVVRDG